MNPDNIVYRAAIWIIPLVIAIVFHEVAHGWMAKWLGDPTAEEQRRLSFNPIRHVDPVGTLILPLGLAIAGAPVFGWAKPVPVIAQRLRNPRWGMVAVALAGPGMNLILATFAAIAIGAAAALSHGVQPTGMAAFVLANLVNFLLVNVFLALFNLLPMPPFDGGHVVEGLLPRPLAAQWAKIGRFGFLLLILVLVVLPMVFPGADLVGRVVGPPAQAVIGWFLALAQAIA
ncbi:site-2 protease family protein [Sphingomonas sp. RP10(2022)]|uniref:Site-2 protease family protein n=1 Tax=Sphingomonas liriopis TaxID=2949094 RepID=A0A9X2HRZ1_9SPHN|nr:site-2 protease family protein [Sphingomonas liriopis]MCP3736103.1 site-2 protease family protein [Sphingomonas liriopis]